MPEIRIPKHIYESIKSDGLVEVEKGEYLQTPDGKTMETLGKRHSQGGELMSLPEGTKVVSDYLKIGAKLATMFKKEYDLNVKAGSTFSTVLDQYKKKIGLTKLLEEETKLMNKIADQEEVEFEGTREINLQVLSGKVNELKPEKEQLENMFENFTNVVFEKQEQTKEPGQSNFEKQEGGAVDPEATAITEDGQPVPQQEQGSDIEQLIMAYSQITGQDPSQIVEQLQQLPEDQLEQAIQQIQQEVQNASQQQAPQEQPQQEEMMQVGGKVKSKDEFLDYLGKYQWEPGYEYGDLAQQAKAIVPFLERNQIMYSPEDLTTQAGMDRLAGYAQVASRDQYPRVSEHYSSQVAPTQQGLQNALDNNLISDKELKDLGVKISNGKVLRGSKGIVPSPEQEQKIQALITKNGQNNAEGYKKYVDTNFVDNKWYFRNQDVQRVKFKDQKELDAFTKDYQTKIDENGKPIYYSNKQGLYFTPELETATSTPVKSSPATSNENTDPNKNLTAIGNRDRNYEDGLPMLTPDQSNLPPNLLQPGLRQIGSVQANAIRISPEETLKELNRQYGTAANLASETNPYTSGAMQANLQAQTNNSINQAYSQAAIVNAQDERNVENTNEQRIQQRDQTNLGLQSEYERLSQTALDNYSQSWRNFIDKRNLENVNNWNLENSRMAFNAVNDNYKIGSMGWFQTDESPLFYTSSGTPMYKDPKTGQVYEVTKKTDTKGNSSITEKQATYNNMNSTRTPRKQKGGLLLSGNIKNLLK